MEMFWKEQTHHRKEEVQEEQRPLGLFGKEKAENWVCLDKEKMGFFFYFFFFLPSHPNRPH